LKLKWPFGRAAQPAPEPEPRLLGLVLGGGSVRGAAHLGVLSVLEREGIRPDIVVGTSVGAIIGAGVAAGISVTEMYGYFKTARWTDIARPSWGSKLSMLDTDPLGALLERIVEARTFDQLALPFAAVAADILTGSTYVFTEGSLRDALVASAAVPGLFEPVRRDGHLLVDGGIADNLPIDAARDLGAKQVVAIDIMPLPDGSYEPNDMRDMLLLSLSIMERPTASQLAQADLVIMPEVSHMSFSDFSQTQAVYEAGVQAAEKALPDLQSLLGSSSNDSRHERSAEGV
jgi:NTE family protein